MSKPKIELNDARVADIAAQIRGAVLGIADGQRAMLTHTDAVKTLSSEIQVTKLDIATQVAALSASNGWLPDEIDAACTRAAKGNGDESDERTQKTMGVMCSEMRVVANPRVCEKFPVILEACNDAWNQEIEDLASVDKEDRASMPTPPVHKFASRLYNLVLTVARAVKKEGLKIASMQDVIDYAVLNDPDFDETKIKAKIAALVSNVTKLYADFGDPNLKLTAEFLEALTAKELLASRAKMLEARALGSEIGDETDEGDDQELVADETNVVPMVAPAIEPEAGTEIATGVSSLDVLLGDAVAA
jgi:hypothetical protein